MSVATCDALREQNMLWIITADHINGKTPDDTPSRVNRFRANRTFAEALRVAPAEAKPAMLQAFRDAMNFEFRLYDDDGELYYEGLCKDLDQQDGDSAFGPLDWAMNDAGCTTMKYRKKGEAVWKTL